MEFFKQRVLTKSYQEDGFLQIQLGEESSRGRLRPHRRDISALTGTMRDESVFMNSDNTLKDHITLRGLRYILLQTLGCELRRNRVDGPVSVNKDLFILSFICSFIHLFSQLVRFVTKRPGQYIHCCKMGYSSPAQRNVWSTHLVIDSQSAAESSTVIRVNTCAVKKESFYCPPP